MALWWDPEIDTPEMHVIILLIVLMLGASSPGYGLEISTDDLYHQDTKMKWSMTALANSSIWPWISSSSN